MVIHIATIRTAIQLFNGMTPALISMTRALNVVISSFEEMERVSGRSVDTASLTLARQELANTERIVNQMEDDFRRLTNQTRNTTSAMEKLFRVARKIAFVIGTITVATKVFNLSDQMASTTARLDLIVDDGGSVEELEKKIQASALRTGSNYLDTAATVAKLGILADDAFSNNDELIYFTELMNKAFTVGGTTAEEQSAAMYQLTQAMAAGKLQGDEYKSILENAPLLADAIEDYMINVKGAEGSMKDWAANGELTAEVIKAALANAADEIEERFANMPLTWGRIWNNMKTYALQAFQPILTKINQLANNEKTQKMIQGIRNGLHVVAKALSTIFDIAIAIGDFFYNNWSNITPIILGVAGALAFYCGWLLITKGMELLSTISKLSMLVATKLLTGATWAQAAAQQGLNAAIWACPLTWIILLIAVLIAIIVAVCAHIAKTSDVAKSAFGVMTGAINVAIAFFVNLLYTVGNVVAAIYGAVTALGHNIEAAFHNAISDVQGWWYDMLSTALYVVEGICEALNKLPFIEFDYSGISAKAAEYAQKAENARNDKMAYESVTDAFEEGLHTYAAFEEGWAKTAFAEGAQWGDEKWAALKDKFGLSDDSEYDIKDAIKGVYDNTGDTAENTAAAADSLGIAEEDLAYIRDIAERDAINRFTTAEIRIEMTNENHIGSDMDVDGIMNQWCDTFSERLNISTEGVHI